MEDRIWDLITKKLIGEATAEELLELDRLLREDAGMRYTVKLLFDWWQFEEQQDETQTRLQFQKILEHIKVAPPDTTIEPDTAAGNKFREALKGK